MEFLAYRPVKKLHYNLNGVIHREKKSNNILMNFDGLEREIIRIDKITVSQNQTTGVIAITDGYNTLTSQKQINDFLYQYGFIDFKHFYRAILCYFTSSHQQSGVELYIYKFFDYNGIIQKEN